MMTESWWIEQALNIQMVLDSVSGLANDSLCNKDFQGIILTFDGSIKEKMTNYVFSNIMKVTY